MGECKSCHENGLKESKKQKAEWKSHPAFFYEFIMLSIKAYENAKQQEIPRHSTAKIKRGKNRAGLKSTNNHPQNFH